jgi:hypothetical protein
MGIGQELIVRPIDGVVQRGFVGPDLDSGYPEQRPVVHEGEPASRFDAVAEPFLLAARRGRASVDIPFDISDSTDQLRHELPDEQPPPQGAAPRN